MKMIWFTSSEDFVDIPQPQRELSVMKRKAASVVFTCVHLVCCLVGLIFVINSYVQMTVRPAIPATSGQSSSNTAALQQQAARMRLGEMQNGSGVEDIQQENILSASSGEWKTVGASHKLFVYSAYYDERTKKQMIRIIGATRRVQSDSVSCTLRYPNSRTIAVEGKIEIIREHHSLNYSACFIKCFFDGQLPESVSVVNENYPHPDNHLRVIDTRKYDQASNWTSQTSKTIGICVQPLHNDYHKTIQLVEFMELNRLLGVNHVTFYNSSISPTTDCILRTYIGEGRASVLPWKDHFKSGKEIVTENIIAALNDCLYRNMHNFTYLAFLDMDEFIMPAQDYTIQQMIGKLKPHTTGKEEPLIGSYDFRNAFFHLDWPDDEYTTSSNDEYERSLTSLLKTRRTIELLPPRDRSKYIAIPTKVETAGNHFVWKFMSGYHGIEYGIEEEKGILNHYRLCDTDMIQYYNITYNRSGVDRTAFRYKHQLVAAVKRRWQKLQKGCGIKDIQHAYNDSV